MWRAKLIAVRRPLATSNTSAMSKCLMSVLSIFESILNTLNFLLCKKASLIILRCLQSTIQCSYYSNLWDLSSIICVVTCVPFSACQSVSLDDRWRAFAFDVSLHSWQHFSPLMVNANFLPHKTYLISFDSRNFPAN